MPVTYTNRKSRFAAFTPFPVGTVKVRIQAEAWVVHHHGDTFIQPGGFSPAG